MQTGKGSVVSGVERAGGMHRRGTEHPGGSETPLYDDAGHHTFVQTTNSEPECKQWALGECDVSVQLHQLQQCISLVGGMDNGRDCEYGGWGGAVGIWKNLLTFLSILL